MEEEVFYDRKYHLRCVKEMLSNCKVLVFTLGLTEAWKDIDRQCTYPSHPAIFSPSFNNPLIIPVNFDYLATYTDLSDSIEILKSINPDLKIILSVSPVGLAATHQPTHVLLATSYAKSVLRAAAGKVAEEYDFVDYFPAFEFFSMSQSFGQFLEGDLRDVSPRGIPSVMSLFETRYFAQPTIEQKRNKHNEAPTFADKITPKEPEKSLAEAECDDAFNDFFDASTT